MMNGQIIPAMTGTEIIVAAVVVLLAAALIGRLWRKLISN